MANTKYPTMFSPCKIGNIEIPNRLVMAPMGVGHFSEFFEERLTEFYGARARGGIGLIFTENCYVSSFEEDPYPRFMPVPRFDDKRKISRAHAIANRVKMYGGVPGIQLGAGQGRNAEAPMKENPPGSASAIPTISNPDVICREMTQEDIDKKIAAFERAAEMAKICEFEVIEVHAHTGYLVEQFLNKNINHRTDKYGGSPENRFRFAKEILEGIRRKVGHTMAVTIRLSIDHKCTDGITLEEGLQYCELAEKAGFDAVHIDAGSRVALDWTVPSPYMGKTPLRYLAREAKKRVHIPVITVGSYLMPEDAEDALRAGDADFVAIGRALLADPDWAKKAKLGMEDQIRGCIQCNIMCSGYNSANKAATCSVNPVCGRENELKITKTDEPKRVTIIGGGPAGMVTALVAAKRGHTVKVLERSGELGGNMNLVSMEDSKDGVRNYNHYIKRQMELNKIDVEYNCEATIEKIRETKPDVVVAATGSYLFVPGIPGFDSEKVVTIKGLHEDVRLKGDERIIVVGGGVNGCEVALELARHGHKVTVVELMAEFAKGLSMINRMSILARMKENENITMLPETACKYIEGDTLVCEDKDGKKLELPFDLVVAAIGMKSENKLAKEILAEFPEAYMIGDAVEHLRIGDAVHQGFFTGLRI